MWLNAVKNALNTMPAAQPDTPGLISAAALILILSILGLLLFALVLVRSVRRLKPRANQSSEPQPRLEDPWFEAGRRMQAEEPPTET